MVIKLIILEWKHITWIFISYFNLLHIILASTYWLDITEIRDRKWWIKVRSIKYGLGQNLVGRISEMSSIPVHIVLGVTANRGHDRLSIHNSGESTENNFRFIVVRTTAIPTACSGCILYACEQNFKILLLDVIY